MSTPAINWPAHSISTNTSMTLYQEQIKLEPRDVLDMTPDSSRPGGAAYSSSYPPYTMESDRHTEEFYRLPAGLDISTPPNSAIFSFDSRYDEHVINALTDEMIQDEMNPDSDSHNKYL